MGYISVTEHLANIHKAVGSIPGAGEKRERKGKDKRTGLQRQKPFTQQSPKDFRKQKTDMAVHCHVYQLPTPVEL